MEEQLSIFSLLREEPQETPLEKCLRMGSRYEGGTVRIAAAMLTMDRIELKKFLREEFSIGGCSFEDGFFSSDSGGCRIMTRNMEELKFSWGDVAGCYQRMFRRGTFPEMEDRIRLGQICMATGGVLPKPWPRLVYPYEKEIRERLQQGGKDGRGEQNL